MSLPDFFVVGASRSGTTWLHERLRAHPAVFVPQRKSPDHFVCGDPIPEWEGELLRRMARRRIADRDRYEALFDPARPGQPVGEVSPPYLQSLAAPRRIHAACPDARVVAILRDPSERAFAHFLGRRRDGLERRRDFRAVVDAELDRGLPDQVAFGSYLACGRYHHFLRPYFDLFGAERISVHLYEDLERDPEGLLERILAFVGVERGHGPAATDTDRDAGGRRPGATGELSNPVLRELWTRSVGLRTRARPYLPQRLRDALSPLRFAEIERPALAPGIRARMVSAVADDVARTQDLIGRDLGSWLGPGAGPAGAGEPPASRAGTAGVGRAV